MVQPGQRPGFWQSVRELPARTPLRVKLITVLLALVALALVVISVAGTEFLTSYLTQQQNAALAADASSGRLLSAAQQYLTDLSTGVRPSHPTAPGVSADWISGGKLYHVVLPTAETTGGYGPTIAGPSYPLDAAWLQSGTFATVSAANGGHWRVVAQSFPIVGANGAPSTGTLVVGLDVSADYQTVGKLITIDWIVSGLLLLVLAVVGVGVIRASLRPLTDIEKTAGAIAEGDLSRRVPERDPRTEVGRLGRSLNTMLAHIEGAFHAQSKSEEEARRSEERMRQFVADASHELRTPLTAIRGFAEYYRQRGGVDLGGRSPGQLQAGDLDRIMRRVEQEAARMGVLVEDMLLLARLDQQRPLDARPVDLLTLAADAVHDARVVAPGRDINLTVGAGAALLVIGDEVRLRQVIGNLMSNALTHTPDGTAIDVLIRSGNLDEAPAGPPPPPAPAWPEDDEFAGTGFDETEFDSAGSDVGGETWNAPVTNRGPQPAAVLEVTDHGPGLTKEQADHVFERFYRADAARTSGGTGLGLAIVAALVAAHGGVTWVRSRPGEGATFSFALPLSEDALASSAEDDVEEPDPADTVADADARVG